MASFVPWQAWRITRWSCIRCPHCSALLNRKFDLQFLFISLFLLASLLPLALSLPIAIRLLLVAILLATGFVLDSYTVKLVRAGKRMGMDGYEA